MPSTSLPLFRGARLTGHFWASRLGQSARSAPLPSLPCPLKSDQFQLRPDAAVHSRGLKTNTVREGFAMRRLALVAILLGLCGCSSRTATPPSTDQTADSMPTGEVIRVGSGANSSTASSAKTEKASAPSYLGPH